MAGVVRASINDILPLIKTRLVAWPILSASRIGFVATTRVPYFDGDQDILLHPRRLVPDDSFDVGGGRIDARVRRQLDVVVRTRLELDESNRQITWLTDASLGHFQLEEKVVDALHLFLPTKTNGDAVLVEPMRLSPSSEPYLDQRNAGWGESVLSFDLNYEMNLNQTITC